MHIHVDSTNTLDMYNIAHVQSGEELMNTFINHRNSLAKGKPNQVRES